MSRWAHPFNGVLLCEAVEKSFVGTFQLPVEPATDTENSFEDDEEEQKHERSQ